ncbi:MAG TPA: histidine kinase dimerization/phospho-acceptor domain-containing protein [Myxococcota bacterium]|nr:histidine kinase dimerization/phospho-acceptor domain-containing protein [Myxococcota bacterium]
MARESTPRINPWHLANTRDEGVMWLAWLVRLRWLAVIAQLLTLSFTFVVLDRLTVVLPILLSLAALLATTNLASMRLLRTRTHIPQEALLAELMLDIVVLTAFLFCAGGTQNPFVMLYLIHVAMAAVMIRNAYAIVVMVAVIVANLLLHVLHLPLHLEEHLIEQGALLSYGQSTAFTVTAVSVGWFIMGMSTTLRRQKHRLMEARERSARTDRLRAVGTLAAGAAHELNTPLSTMVLRLRRVARRHEDADTVKDLEVLRAQLDRCKQIVDRLLVGAGDPSADGLQVVALDELVDGTVKMWGKGTSIDVSVERVGEPVIVELPPVAFSQAFINLLENAREAQAEVNNFEPLVVRVAREGRTGVVLIQDHGPGLPDQPDRVGEPFFTTKATGTGLGVFVARSVAEGAGGGLRYDRVGGLTVTRWWFPESERSA